jgi:hypothetical protein
MVPFFLIKYSFFLFNAQRFMVNVSAAVNDPEMNQNKIEIKLKILIWDLLIKLTNKSNRLVNNSFNT